MRGNAFVKMSERKIVLGIDTSNYTTSLGVMFDDGELIANIKRPLPVKDGERGLRQSDAVFNHVKNLPFVMDELRSVLDGGKISIVGVSTRPRNVEGSYMPCFLVGVGAAETISATENIPIRYFSHQCGHVMAAIYSAGRNDLLDGRDFCAFHVSGGTTEMLRVRASDNGFTAELVGGSADLNAGQVIDRVGVMMGLPFPAGPYIEALALEYSGKIPKKKPKINGFEVNLSGLENIALKMYQETEDKKLVSAFVLDYVGEALSLLAEKYEDTYGKTDFLFAGGVMSNSIIKNKLAKRYCASFAEPKLSSDNAVGIAALCIK